MSIADIQNLLNEATTVISGIENPERIEGFREPIVDELQGLALMLPEVIQLKPRRSQLEGLAHELWSAAQLTPGESIRDGVERLLTILSNEARAVSSVATPPNPAQSYRYTSTQLNELDPYNVVLYVQPMDGDVLGGVTGHELMKETGASTLSEAAMYWLSDDDFEHDQYEFVTVENGQLLRFQLDYESDDSEETLEP